MAKTKRPFRFENYLDFYNYIARAPKIFETFRII